jgi:CDP-diacylglycerol--glycerol-3-phosphate 3-phosphatidyltransferase
MCLAFVSVALFRHGHAASVAALALMVVAIWLDAVDGYVARRSGRSTDAGAAFDIAADRVVENVYWIFFAVAGLITFWIPMIVIARGCLTDFLRGLAFKQGQTAFGEKTMMQTWLGRMLTGSRLSRAAYGIVKCAAFFALGARIVLDEAPQWRAMLAAGIVQGLQFSALALAIAAVAFCVIRGVPVIVEGLRFFRKTPALTIQ